MSGRPAVDIKTLLVDFVWPCIQFERSIVCGGRHASFFRGASVFLPKNTCMVVSDYLVIQCLAAKNIVGCQLVLVCVVV